LNKTINDLEKKLNKFPKQLAEIKKINSKEIVLLNKKIPTIKTRHLSPRSKANQKLKSLFDRATLIPESEKIVYLSRLRLEKGNPPKDLKLGDALIWESLLSYLSETKDCKELVFIGSDSSAWGEDDLNPWLEKEFKEKTKSKIKLTKTLSDINALTSAERASIEVIEKTEQKDNALSSFLGVYGYISASQKLGRLLHYKDLLTLDDYILIIKEFIKNSSVINSYYTSWKVKEILSQEDSDQVVEKIERIKKDVLDEINDRYGLELKRSIDIDNSNPIF